MPPSTYSSHIVDSSAHVGLYFRGVTTYKHTSRVSLLPYKRKMKLRVETYDGLRIVKKLH